MDKQDQFDVLEDALRRNVPPEEPLAAKLQDRIVTLIRAEARGRVRIATFRRFAIGAAAVAACVLLTVAFVAMNRGEVSPSPPIAQTPDQGADENIFAKIPPTEVIVDDSILAVQEFATGSVVQEMRDLAQDASEIGSSMLAALPVDVDRRGPSQWWSELIEK
jgi:hypothetical protein